MLPQNSYAEFVLGTLSAMLKDFADMYPRSTKEFERDEKRLSSAIDSQGVEFALVVLPAFRKHFDKCLSNGRLTRSGLAHFGSVWRGSPIPRLFRGLMLRVFDRSGTLRADADVVAIRCIRQVLGTCRKLRKTSSIHDTRQSVKEYLRLEYEVEPPGPFWTQDSSSSEEPDTSVSFADYAHAPQALGLLPECTLDHAGRSPIGLLVVAQQVADLITSELGVFDPHDWHAKHGPGAVADRRLGNAYKYAFPTWSARLDSVFPISDYGYHSYSSWASAVLASSMPVSTDVPARLVAVPKTLKTPRLIAVEPTANQWCQQIIRDFLYARVRETFIGRSVSFRKQELNGELALKASQDQTHATIDLSSASDRISCEHVGRLFRRSPALLQAMRASRSAWLQQDICGHSPKFVKLRKYSTMGNATTFPVQSLFFLTLALASGLYARGLRVSKANISALQRQQVRVFGDDIIVPNDFSSVLVELLHTLGLRVNTAKTFEFGKFKESCGVDAYSGHNVTTVNVMDVPQAAKPGSLVSTVDVVNNLHFAGYFRTADWIRRFAERQGLTKVPVVKRESGSFGWHDGYGVRPVALRKRWNERLFRHETHCLKLVAKDKRAPAYDDYGLLQFFTEASATVTSAVSTLGYRIHRPHLSLRMGWA